MNKAREFDDFILDDYDYNLLEDWDLEYLWEWVEFDDFSDLQYEFSGAHAYDPDGLEDEISEIAQPQPPPDPPAPSKENNAIDELEDDEQEFLRSIGLLDENNDLAQDLESEETTPQQEAHNTTKNTELPVTPELLDIEEENIDPFDISFDYGDENDTQTINSSPPEAHQDKDTVGDDFLRSIGLLDETSEQVKTPQNYQEDAHNSQNDLDEEDTEGDDFLRSIGLLDDDPEEDDDGFDDDDDDDIDYDSEILGGKRYIETSAGTIDIELDDILAELQKLEFDEFIEVLKENNHVYHKILDQREWSEEEMDFLKSIKPLIENPDKPTHQPTPEPETKPIDESKMINTRIYESAKDMFADLSKKATILAQQQNRNVTYTPKNMRKLWTIDNEKMKQERIRLLFGKKIMTIDQQTMTPSLHKSQNNMASVIFGKNDSRYHELLEIITGEIKVMHETLDAQSLDFIRQDGKRFCIQFTDFLVQKYGTKIYYLYQSQFKNTVLAERISQDIADIVMRYLAPHDLSTFLSGYFEAIFIVLDDNGIDI